VTGERADTRTLWLESAACRGLTFWLYENVFDDEGNVRDEVALRSALCYCDNCPVIDECEDTVTEQERGKPLEDRFGVCAGMTPHERWVADGSPVSDLESLED
jgi:hypothetical protein